MGLQRVGHDLVTKQQQWRFLKKLGIKNYHMSQQSQDWAGKCTHSHTHTRVWSGSIHTHTWSGSILLRLLQLVVRAVFLLSSYLAFTLSTGDSLVSFFIGTPVPLG